VTVAASAKDVWRAWTTSEGIKSFFGRDAEIELAVGGKFEVYFALDAPRGSRGSEGCKVLAFLPEKMLAFSWNAPPSIPSLRDAGARTQIVLEFTPENGGATHVALTQHGLGEGEDWDKYLAYFDRAWGNVLASLEEHFAPSGGSAKAAEPPSATQHWVYFIRPARADFFEKSSEAERELLQAHVAHIKKLLDDGKLILAGPCEDPAYYPQSSAESIKLEMPTPGIVVFEARDAEEARRIMEADPAVKAGVFKARVNRFHLAFQRD
jgi:uncharacterized protein YndB with AHSA1/START domain/uncharacterized protein YciI